MKPLRSVISHVGDLECTATHDEAGLWHDAQRKAAAPRRHTKREQRVLIRGITPAPNARTSDDRGEATRCLRVAEAEDMGRRVKFTDR